MEEDHEIILPPLQFKSPDHAQRGKTFDLQKPPQEDHHPPDGGENEFASGNYVIVGGDWNQYPPDFKADFSTDKSFTGIIGNFNLTGIESDYLPGEWKWIFDPATPSVRTLTAAYDPGVTPTSVCDVFLVSPNIEPVFVKCHNLGFNNSDHNPVIVQVKLM